MDEKRKKANRNFCCPCKVHIYETNENNNQSNDQSNVKKHISANSTPPPPPLTTHLSASQVNTMEQCEKTFGIPAIMDRFIIPLLSTRLHRVIVIIIFIIILILSIVSLSSLDTTSDTSRLVPDDSYAIDYFDEYDDGFGDQFLITFQIIIEDQDFSDPIIRNNTKNMFNEIELYRDGESYAIGEVDNWLEPFEEYISDTVGLDIDSLDQTEFYNHLQTFANVSSYAEWEDEIIYDDDDNPTKIVATKFFVSYIHTYYIVFLFVVIALFEICTLLSFFAQINFAKPDTLREQWPLMLDLDDIIEKYLGKNSGFFFEDVLVFSYFEYVITDLTLTNIIAACGGVFIILVLFVDLRMAVFILIIVIMINVDLFGWMVICNVALDSLSFLQLVMAGLCLLCSFHFVQT